jgi:uncharacterized protein
MSDYVIETATGGFIDYSDPDSLAIKIEDIARGLTFQPRFMGQTTFFYSVAQHSLMVCQIVGDLGGTVAQGYHGLLHDAHEAYIGDCPTPLKRLYGDTYEVVREGLDYAITSHFDLQPNAFHDPLVKLADAIALRAEAHVLKHTSGRDSRWDRAWAENIDDHDWKGYCATVEKVDTFTAVEQQFLGAAGKFELVMGR